MTQPGHRYDKWSVASSQTKRAADAASASMAGKRDDDEHDEAAGEGTV